MLTLHTDPIKYISVMKFCKSLMAIHYFYCISHSELLMVRFLLLATFSCVIYFLYTYVCIVVVKAFVTRLFFTASCRNVRNIFLQSREIK